MALYISKVKLPNNTEYLIKDAAAWEVLTSFFGEPTQDSEGVYHFPKFAESSEGTIQQIIQSIINNEYITEIDEAATYEVTASSEDIVDNGEKLTRAGDIKAYVDSMMLDQAFDVVVTETLPTASADTFHKLYFLPATDSEATAPNEYKEYITIRDGVAPNYTYRWELIGDTSMSLEGYATESFVQNEIKKIQIAGVDVTLDNVDGKYKVSAADLKNALSLGALAYKDKASGTVAAQSFTGLKATGSLDATVQAATLTQTDTAAVVTYGDYTPSGTITVTEKNGTKKINVSADYTPTGSVSPEAGSTVQVLKSVSLAADNNGSFQVAGTNAASAVTFDNTGSTVTVVTGVTGQAAPSFTEGAFTPASLGDGFYSAGSAASFTEGTFTPASITKTNVNAAQDAVVASYQNDNNEEMLVFSTPTINTVTYVSAFDGGSKAADTFTANTPTAINTDAFDGGSKAADTFSAGSYGTLSTDSAIKTLGKATAAAQDFTGNKYSLNTTNEEVLSDAATFAFSGTQATINSTGDNQLLTGVSATFAGDKQTDFKVNGVTYKKAEIGQITVTISNPELTVEDFTVTAKTVEVQ